MQRIRSAGFTMLEIVMALAIIGVLSAVASGVISGIDNAVEAGEAEQMRMDLRFAQQRAMGSTTDVLFEVSDSDDWYELPAGMVFMNGLQRVQLRSDLKTSSGVIFSAQTGLPDRACIYQLGAKQTIRINGQTGMIR